MVTFMHHINMTLVINTTGHITVDSETFVDPFLPPSYFSDIIVSAQGSDSAELGRTLWARVQRE